MLIRIFNHQKNGDFESEKIQGILYVLIIIAAFFWGVLFGRLDAMGRVDEYFPDIMLILTAVYMSGMVLYGSFWYLDSAVAYFQTRSLNA